MNNPIAFFAFDPQDNEEVRLEKVAAFLVSGSCTLAGLLWCVMYYLIFGWGLIAFLPVVFVSIVGAALIVSHITKNAHYTIYAQIVCIIYIPTFIQWNIGSVFDSGFVLVWSFVGPMCALMFFSIRGSIPWFLLFLVNLAVTVIFDDYFAVSGQHVAATTRTFFFIMNLGFASAVVFIFASYYVTAADKEQKKTTKLLEANLQQEMILRESEKLATLGRLSAGVAHELNNPVATTQRDSEQLQDAITKLAASKYELGRLNLSEEQLDKLQLLASPGRQSQPLADPVERHDQESELESFCDSRGLQNSWELAPVFVRAGISKADLDELAQQYDKKELMMVLDFISNSHTAYHLLKEIRTSSGKITEIVKAMRSYSFHDQADFKKVDIHEGLDDTLLMLQNQLNKNITVNKKYDLSLPWIEVYAGELNQVWTNIIDNALYALNGKGQLTITTSRENSWFVVEIMDSGPGIAKDIQSKVFDPFFTTKSPGQGTGLGLNVSHNIVVKKHKGQITIDSKPGETRFTVKLPLG